MHVDITFRPGGKTLLTALLNSIKDFTPTQTINLVFTPRGLAVRFSAHPSDDRAVVAFHLDSGNDALFSLNNGGGGAGGGDGSGAGDQASPLRSSGSGSNDAAISTGAAAAAQGSTSPMISPVSSHGSSLPTVAEVGGGTVNSNSDSIPTSPPLAPSHHFVPHSPYAAAHHRRQSSETGSTYMSHSRTRSTDSIPALTDNLSSLSIPASSPRPASITSIHSVSGNTASVASTPSSAAFGAAIGSPQASGAAWVGAFQKYDCKRGNITVGLNPRALVQQLMLVDDEDKITIRADESEGGIVLLYELYFESPDLGKKCLYEMDAIPRIDRLGPLPRTKYQIVCQIAADEFARIIGALADVSDKIVISANKNSMTFMATGSDGTLQVGLVQKPAALGETTPRFKVLSFHHTVRQTFDSRYLRGFTLATPLSPSVVLHLGTGRTPLRVTYPIVVDSVGGSESLVLSTAASAKRGVVRSPGEDAEGVQQVVGQLHYVLYPEAEVGGL